MGTTASLLRLSCTGSLGNRCSQLTVCHTEAGKATAIGTGGQRHVGGRATFQTLLQEQEDPAGGGGTGHRVPGVEYRVVTHYRLVSQSATPGLRRPTLA